MGHTSLQELPTSCATALGSKGPQAKPNTFWKDTVRPAANVFASSLTDSVLMPYNTPVMALTLKKIAEMHKARTANCQKATKTPLLWTTAAALPNNSTALTVAQSAAKPARRLHHFK